MRVYNEEEKKEKVLPKEFKIRRPKKRGSDGLMNVVFDKPALRTDITERVRKRNKLMEQQQVWCVADLPTNENKQYGSFIYEEMFF